MGTLPAGPATAAPSPGDRPSFLGRRRLVFVRPEDEATRARVAEALERAGTQVAQVFRTPFDVEAVRTYLRGPGRSDAVVIPYSTGGSPSAVELAAALCEIDGAPRHLVMTTRTASASAVREALRRALGPREAGVFVVTLSDLFDGAHTAALAAYLRGAIR
jgi:hypothetical protein